MMQAGVVFVLLRVLITFDKFLDTIYINYDKMQKLKHANLFTVKFKIAVKPKTHIKGIAKRHVKTFFI